MRVSEDGAALALQPTTAAESTALTRLRGIFRRATQYALPSPYWEDPDGYGVDADGEDVLVVPDGMAGATGVEGEATGAARTDDGVELPDDFSLPDHSQSISVVDEGRS